MTEREMLELAATAIGLENHYWGEVPTENLLDYVVITTHDDGRVSTHKWNPLGDDGDALRLAVKLNLDIRYESYDAGIAVIVGAAWDGAPEAVHEIFERDGACALRRAIVRAAAEIGRSKHE